MIKIIVYFFLIDSIFCSSVLGFLWLRWRYCEKSPRMFSLRSGYRLPRRHHRLYRPASDLPALSGSNDNSHAGHMPSLAINGD